MLDREVALQGNAARRSWLALTVCLAILLVLGVLGYIAYDLLPPWLRHPQDSDARWLERQAVLAFLNGLLIGYGLALVVAAVGTVGIAISWRWLRAPWAKARSRLLLLGIAMLASLLALEAGAAAWHSWLHHSPRFHALDTEARANFDPVNDVAPSLSVRFPGGPTKTNGAFRPMKFLVIGESSGRGEPYHPWLSVGQIVAWRLEQVFRGRPIAVDIWATGGADLETTHNKLANLTYRPDAIIVYVGHNEFPSHYSWMRDVDYYVDGDMAPRGAFLRISAPLTRISPFCRLIDESRERQLIDLKPPRLVTRELVDRPVCTPAEAAAMLGDFRRRLEAIAGYCESIGTLPIFVIPPSNDAGFDPSRSVLAPETTKRQRVAFARAVAQARALEATDRDGAIRIDRELVQAHAEFAESHYRLARLLEQTGCWDEAQRHFIAAREGDAMPLRCPEPFRRAFRDVAARHPGLLLVDGPKVLESKSPHGIVDERFFHDAQHPNLRGYVALAEEVLNQMGARRLLGWPAAAPVPAVDVEACLRHFQIDPERWRMICSRESWFFHVTAYIRYDPKFRNEQAIAYERAATALEAGVNAADAGIPGWPLPHKRATSSDISVTVY
jgi:hypothetical protein